MSSESDGRPFDLIERVSLWTSAFCMVGMVLLILAEVVLRGVFNSTTEHSDELVGYLLVGLSFLSLALCQSRGAFHGSRWCRCGWDRAARRFRRWSSTSCPSVTSR